MSQAAQPIPTMWVDQTGIYRRFNPATGLYHRFEANTWVEDSDFKAQAEAAQKAAEEEALKVSREAEEAEKREMEEAMKSYSTFETLRANGMTDELAKDTIKAKESEVARKETKKLVNKIKRNQITAVWVEGVPVAAGLRDLKAHFSRAGAIKESTTDFGEPLIKLYPEKPDSGTQSALVNFERVESVRLAISLLDGTSLLGSVVSVAEAEWDKKKKKQKSGAVGAGEGRRGGKVRIPGDGSGAPKPKPKQKLSAEEAKFMQDAQRRRRAKRFGWDDEEVVAPVSSADAKKAEKRDKNVVLLGAFTPTEMDSDPRYWGKVKSTIEGSVKRIIGSFKKIEIFDRNPEGAMRVSCKEVADAVKLVRSLNGSFFLGKPISAEIWDGTTRYEVRETEEQRVKREATMTAFLNTQ